MAECDRCGCKLTKENNKRGYSICDYCSEILHQEVRAEKAEEKLKKIERLVNSWDGSIVPCENDWKYISEIKEVLEQE